MPLLMTLQYIWRSFRPRLSFPRFGDTAVYWPKNRQNRQFVPTPVS